jgi:hypothetical protein
MAAANPHSPRGDASIVEQRQVDSDHCRFFMPAIGGINPTMSSIKPYQYDPEAWDDQEDPATFERVRKQTGKPTTIKDTRKQQGKEWGRAMHKYHKQRARSDKP